MALHLRQRKNLTQNECPAVSNNNLNLSQTESDETSEFDEDKLHSKRVQMPKGPVVLEADRSWAQKAASFKENYTRNESRA